MSQEVVPLMARNKLLSLLPAGDLQRLAPLLQVVPLKLEAVLYQEDAAMEHAYFPIRGTLSALNVMENGSAIEVATVGDEGAVGMGLLIGATRSLNRVFVQLDGEALRINAADFQHEAARLGNFRQLMLNYLTMFYAQVSQSVACNGLHPVEKRCCRWLLMTLDRTIGDELTLTHEFLSVMLGVRRAGVTEVLKLLTDRGFISHSRGHVKVLDRAGLESMSCECYRSLQNRYDSLFSAAHAPVTPAM